MVVVALTDRAEMRMQRSGDPWQSWDAGRVWAALACWGCCLEQGHVPLACNPDEIPEAMGHATAVSDAQLNPVAIRADLQHAISALLREDAQQRRPRAAEIRGLIAGICTLGPATKHSLIHPHDEHIARIAHSIRNARPREVGWVEYEATHWADVAQRLHLEDWEDARRRARTLCVALAHRLGFVGQYRWE